MGGANTLEFTDENFETEVLQSDKPVLVDFWAEWCAPCKALAPIIQALADENTGKVKIGKLNTDTSQETSVRYAVSAIPTVILFNNGEIVEKFVGLRQKKDFQAAIDAIDH